MAAEPEIADGNLKSETSEKGPGEGDPLLGSGAFIDSVPDDEGGVFEPGVAIDAKPISVYDPQENTAKKSRSKEEMPERPSWLPEDWKIDFKVRNSGVTKGHVDRYYVEPTGKRRFRSKNEVLNFLETGSSLKRKPTSEADDSSASATPSSQSRKKTKAKSKK